MYNNSGLLPRCITELHTSNLTLAFSTFPKLVAKLSVLLPVPVLQLELEAS